MSNSARGPWTLIEVPRTHPNDKRPPQILVSRDRGDGFRECLRDDGFVSVSNADPRYLYSDEAKARAAIARAG